MSVFVLVSCDHLDIRPIQDLNDDELWSHATYGEGLLTRAYTNLDRTWDVQSEYYTDNAVPSTPGANLLALGGWTLEGNPIGSWDSWYTTIRYLNEFLDNGRTLLYSVTDPVRDRTLKRYRIGEAYFLRAWYQWMLLRTYGGFVAGETEAMGFPIVTRVLSREENLNLPRNTYEECVAQIVVDLDSAASILPDRYTGSDVYLGVRNVGRASRFAALTLKAKVYLWAASPAYGPSTYELWDRAARAAHDAIVAQGGNSSLSSYGNWYTSASSSNFIWLYPASNTNSLEYSYYPPSLYGSGLCNPSQNLVDAFPTADGYPIDVSATYDADAPYNSRDPRLALNVFYNGMDYNSTIISTYDGGNDAPGGLSKQGTRTGYYMRKLLVPTVRLTPGNTTSVERVFVFLHKTDLYLMFAEAANEAYGPDVDSLSFTAYDIMRRIRGRSGTRVDSDPVASGYQDAYLDAQRDAGQDAFRTLIRNERRLELAFEGHRFWDLRRWNEPLDHTIRGVQITKDASDILTFNYRDVEEPGMVTIKLMRKSNYSDMKKIALALIMFFLLVSCYDEFRTDYGYTTVAFPSVTGNSSTAGVLGRTVVKNEGLKLDIGVYIAGVLENEEDRWVKFVVDPTLMSDPEFSAYELMPSDYYTLSNPNTITIPKGSFIGRLTITLDSAKFLDDEKSLEQVYAIPFRLTETSADSILSTQSTMLLQLSYINHYEGYYDQTGTYQTFDATATVINEGTFTNVVYAKTIELDTVLADGLVYTGVDFRVIYNVKSDNTVEMWKIPVAEPVPANLASAASGVTTSYVSSWENILAIRDGYDPTSSSDKTGGAYGNWNSSNTWRWVSYTWNNYYLIDKSEIYYWTDGGGIQIPSDSYIEYLVPGTTDTWETVPNHSGFTNLADQYNVCTFDEIMTKSIRVWLIHPVESTGILEWKVWGIMAAVTPEQSRISEVIPQGTCVFNQATSTFELNYRVNYIDETFYTIVNTDLAWRNRVRDGVNEWRR